LKIVDAVWEKRNLGVDCIEAAIEATDTAAEVANALARLTTQYLVVKVPAGRVDVMLRLSELGCAFIEASIHVTRKVSRLELSGVQKKLADSVSYAPMQDGDLPVLWDELRKGMHDTDRIYLDPYFTKEQSANRYIGWIQDETARGAQVYKLIYRDQSIGYFTMKSLGGGVYYPFLAGMYRSHRDSGLGFNISYKPLCEVAARGGSAVSTHISASNANVVRLHAGLGFRFDEFTYVYIRHYDGAVTACS
jgi:hypothetical protein